MLGTNSAYRIAFLLQKPDDIRYNTAKEYFIVKLLYLTFTVILLLTPYTSLAQTRGDEDLDQDGYSAIGGDCNDQDYRINPGAYDEPNNGVDEDCDGSDAVARALNIDPVPGELNIDPISLTEKTKKDLDYDGWTVSDGDCDDNDYYINPGAYDVPNNGIDEDCDGWDAKNDVIEQSFDMDEDGYSREDGDCDDNDYYINPGAYDVPNNGIDEDCNGFDAKDETPALDAPLTPSADQPGADITEDPQSADIPVLAPPSTPPADQPGADTTESKQPVDTQQPADIPEPVEDDATDDRCPPGYEFQPRSGVGCVQINCNDIKDAHYGYTRNCVCGSSGSINENPDAPNKECSFSLQYEKCPGCVYACVDTDELCPHEKDKKNEDDKKDQGQPRDNSPARDKDDVDTDVEVTINDNETEVAGMFVDVAMDIKGPQNDVEYRIKDKYRTWSDWEAYEGDVEYELTPRRIKNQVTVEYRITGGKNEKIISQKLYVPSVATQNAVAAGVLCLTSFFAFLAAFNWVGLIDTVNDIREILKEKSLIN